MFKTTHLDQTIIDDLFNMEKMGAKGFVAKQVDRYLESLDTHIDEIRSAIKDSNFEKIIDHAHKINGFSGTLGALKLRIFALDLEKTAMDKNAADLERKFNVMLSEIENVVPEFKEVSKLSKSNL